jgi:hypothetical protein
MFAPAWTERFVTADDGAGFLRLQELEAERDRLVAELREALQRVEYWRTLAEYRQATLLARQLEDAGKIHAPRWIDYLLSDQEKPADKN